MSVAETEHQTENNESQAGHLAPAVPQPSTGDSLAKDEHITEPVAPPVGPYAGTSIISQMIDDPNSPYYKAEREQEEHDENQADGPLTKQDYDGALNTAMLIVCRHFLLSTADVLAHSQMRQAMSVLEDYTGDEFGAPTSPTTITATGGALPIGTTTTGTVDDDPTIAPVDPKNPKPVAPVTSAGPSSTTISVPVKNGSGQTGPATS